MSIMIVLLPCNMSTALCKWILNLVSSGCKLLSTTSLWALFTHWLFSYPVICPLLYVHGCWIWFLQDVSYFEQPHCRHCYTLIVFLPCNMSTALYWIWFLHAACKLFDIPHYEHCITLIFLLPCNMSTALCAWILNLVPSGCKSFWTTSLLTLLHTHCSLTL